MLTNQAKIVSLCSGDLLGIRIASLSGIGLDYRGLNEASA